MLGWTNDYQKKKMLGWTKVGQVEISETSDTCRRVLFKTDC